MEQHVSYEREINLEQLVHAVLRKIKIIILAGLFFAILVAGYRYITAGSSMGNQEQVTYQPVTDYIGRANIYLGSAMDAATAEAMRTYLTGNEVIQSVISELNLNSEQILTYWNVYNMINLQNSTDTMIMITVAGPEEVLVQDVTDLLSTIGAQKLSEKFNKDGIILLEPAYTEQRFYNNEVKSIVKNTGLIIKELVKYIVIGFVLGVFLCSGLYMFLFIIDSSIKDEKDIAGHLGIPVLGKIPVIRGTNESVRKSLKKKKHRLTQYANE